MKYHYKSTQEMSRLLTVVCFMLFVIYSFVLFLKYQYGIVALTYFIESNLNHSASAMSVTWVSAMLGTVLSTIPALILLNYIEFPIRFKALALLPSYIVLGFITGISPENITSVENTMPVFSSLVLFVLSITAIFLSQFIHENRSEHSPFPNYLWSNLFISCLGILFTISLTNSDSELHNQLDLAYKVHENNITSDKFKLNCETRSNNTITSLQALCLSKECQLAERLFSVSNLHGSSSLLPDSVPATMVYHTPTLVYGHLRAIPVGKCKKASSFLSKALERRTSKEGGAVSPATIPLVDYYLCSLLLDKNLSLFVTELPKYYNTATCLPRHYREALVLSQAHNVTLPFDYTDDDMYAQYQGFIQTKEAHLADIALQRKMCSYYSPCSYWNYYHFEPVNQ